MRWSPQAHARHIAAAIGDAGRPLPWALSPAEVGALHRDEHDRIRRRRRYTGDVRALGGWSA